MGRINDFEDGEIYGFSAVSNKEGKSPIRMAEIDRRRRIYHFGLWERYGRMGRIECKFGRKEAIIK